MLFEDLLPTRARQHSAERPAERCLSFLDDDLDVTASLTYRELDDRARSVAAALVERGLVGAPVVLSFPPGLEFVTAFTGCLYAGAVAVPATLPRSHRSAARLAAILGDSDTRCVLTTSEHHGNMERDVSVAAERVDVVATDELEPVGSGIWLPRPEPDQLAFLQYTSGSTRSPRGVMVRHGHLAANLDSLREVLGFDRSSVEVSWLPVFHDMGLIAGVLLPLWLGFPSYLMAPSAFVRNPLSWIQAIARYRGTHGGAPNFAYQACVDAAPAVDLSGLDLTCWRVAWNGAEPIRHDTLDRFRARFKPNGLRAETVCGAYGLAESTLLVSGSSGSEPGSAMTVDEAELQIGQVRLRTDDTEGAKRLAGSGRPGTGIDVRIVRPDVRRLAEPDAIGEIWVRSASVAQGYWQHHDETEKTFGAHLATGEGPYLRTGDLGFVHDRELFVIGRCKDVIVIRGVNYYPHDVEYTVERSHPALQPDAGAVIGIERAGHVDLVALHEIRGDCPQPILGDQVVDAIRRHVGREHHLALARVVLLRPGGLPKTSSGKVQRAKCREELGGSGLPVLHEWESAGAKFSPIAFNAESLSQPGVLERQLVHWLQSELSLTGLTWRTPLTELGIDSLKGVELVNVLSSAFGYPFPATSLLDHPTVVSLANLIRDAKVDFGSEPRPREDERELTDLLRRRVDDILLGGR